MKNNENLVFIAGGVGITPFMSMIKNQLNSNKYQNTALLYCAKTKKDIIFKDELNKIKVDWFKKIYILSKEKSSDKEYKHGRISEEIIKKCAKDVKNSLFYICGPEPMKNNTIKILKDMGVKKENIKIESFFW